MSFCKCNNIKSTTNQDWVGKCNCDYFISYFSDSIEDYSKVKAGYYIIYRLKSSFLYYVYTSLNINEYKFENHIFYFQKSFYKLDNEIDNLNDAINFLKKLSENLEFI